MTEQQAFSFANDSPSTPGPRKTRRSGSSSSGSSSGSAPRFRHRTVDWRIDERTRAAGRAGIAQARATLLGQNTTAA